MTYYYTSYYSLSPSDLEHHGIKGMHWGIRRFQNKDGSLTAKGRKRYSLDGILNDAEQRSKRSSGISERPTDLLQPLKTRVKQKLDPIGYELEKRNSGNRVPKGTIMNMTGPQKNKRQDQWVSDHSVSERDPVMEKLRRKADPSNSVELAMEKLQNKYSLRRKVNDALNKKFEQKAKDVIGRLKLNKKSL